MRKSNHKANLALLILCTVWGATWVVSKHAIVVAHIAPLQLSGMRYLLASTLLVSYFLYKGFGFPNKKNWGNIILLSFLMFVCSNGFSTYAVATVGSGLGAVIGALSALWMAIFSYLILQQQLTYKTVIGLLVGFAGVVVIFYDKLYFLREAKFVWGIILSIVATITWALGTIYTIKTTSTGNALYNSSWQMLVSGIVLTAISYTQPRIATTDISLQGWVDVGILVTAGSLLTLACLMYVLQKLPASKVSIYVYINPIIAVLLGHVVFDEALTPLLAVGVIVILLGVYLVNNSLKIVKPKLT